MHHWQIGSDITILGKGINTGFSPLSALLINERVASAIPPGFGDAAVGHARSNNPASAAIANAVIEYIASHNLVDRAKQVGATLGEELQDLASYHSLIGDVR